VNRSTEMDADKRRCCLVVIQIIRVHLRESFD
jgi:hypothetical protein